MKKSTYILMLSLTVSLGFNPTSVFSSDWHGKDGWYGKRTQRIAGNVYAGNLTAECSTGVDFAETDLLTFNFDGTYTVTSQGVQRRNAVQISPEGVETSELVEYKIECAPVAFSIERFKHAFLIKNAAPTQCSGLYLSSAGNITAGDSFTFSQQAGTQVTLCDRTLQNCQYSDTTLDEEFQTIDIEKLGGFFPFLATCRRNASFILIDRKYKKW